MRKSIIGGLLVVMVIAQSGHDAVAGGIEQGYLETVKVAQEDIREGQRAAEYVRGFCGTQRETETLGREEFCGTKDKMAVNRDLCASLLSKSTFTDRVTAGMGERLAQRYPGSNMNCNQLTGVFRGNGFDNHIVNGQINRIVQPPYEGLTWEANMGWEGGRIKTVVYSVSDISGNYIRLVVDVYNPSASQYIDARLPIALQSGIIATGEKALTLTGNELIWALNEVYKSDGAPTHDSMHAAANSLLLKPDIRAWFVSKAVALSAENKGGQR